MQEPVDVAFSLHGSFSHCLTNDAALSCLQNVHASLKPGGLLLLELAHPWDLFDGTLMHGGDAWDAKEGEITIEYGSSEDEWDAVKQVQHGVWWIFRLTCLALHSFA